MPIQFTALKPGQTTPPSLLQYALSRYVLNAGGGSPITVRGGTFVTPRPGGGQKLRSGLFLPWGISVLANLPLR